MKPAIRRKRLEALVEQKMTGRGKPTITLEADIAELAEPYIAAARHMYTAGTDDVEIDDEPAVSPGGDPGVWVAAWVWVSDEEIMP